MSTDIQAIEISLEQAKALVDRKNQALKLASNREFKKLILEGYFKDEASRLTLLLADHTQQAYRDQILQALDGISCLHQHLTTIVRMGEVAEQEMIENQELLDEERGYAVEDE